MHKTFAVLLCAHLLCLLASAQPYVEGGNTRHRFAQLNMGVETRWFSGNGATSAFIDPGGKIVPYDLSNEADLRLVIGGTHFWGHSDFYLSVPIVTLSDGGDISGVETGMKIFPWRIENRRLRPYLGTALYPSIYQQGHGATLVRFKAPLLGGLVYNSGNVLLELGAGFNYNNEETYYISRTTPVEVHNYPAWLTLSIRWMMETTLSAEPGWKKGITQQYSDSLGRLHRLDGFTAAFGISTAFFLKTSPHNASAAPYIDNHKVSHVFPDMGLGYYFYKPDLQLNLAYRSIHSGIDAHEFFQDAYRKSLALEAVKFFADYHGFAAFAGPALSYEWLRLEESDHELHTGQDASWEGLKPGLTFGWDIRPNRIQSWYLRTNLRWFPNLDVTTSDNLTVSFDQLEFNFIQLVIFPGRFF